MSKKIKKLLKKNRTNILATFVTSKNTNVVKELEAYTSEIGNLKGIKKVFQILLVMKILFFQK